MDKAGVATYADWADRKAEETGVPRQFFEDCEDIVRESYSEVPERQEAEIDRRMHESSDCWGPCCRGCEWSGQPHKPCAVCKGGLG
jgi:hypothetical protein